MGMPDENEAVRGLLNLISTNNKNLEWKKRCIYSNGQDNNVLEIKFYQYPRNTQVGRIVYNANSGNVLQMKYRGAVTRAPGHIVDILLDMINLENECHSQSLL
ncbi:hypothetical protein OKW21_001323 [Catalinimonas alkaloidigena]|uniref:hypothetical protein n=1 Tax=Catalinimonas alkaloidigena TaxID=1075417 RepID=UPI00240495E0|nr:hypothetical protein [Catalinimonas alkaloidigena]MDF9796060.1 hypothetical protein [Catalinimonas alkaloidigena]